MAFRSRELSILAYANGFTLWHYRTDDPLEMLTSRPSTAGRGYFDAAREMLRSGDQIIVNLVDDRRIAVANLAVIAVDRAGSVEVATIGKSPEAPTSEGMAAA